MCVCECASIVCLWSTKAATWLSRQWLIWLLKASHLAETAPFAYTHTHTHTQCHALNKPADSHAYCHPPSSHSFSYTSSLLSLKAMLASSHCSHESIYNAHTNTHSHTHTQQTYPLFTLSSHISHHLYSLPLCIVLSSYYPSSLWFALFLPLFPLNLL